MLETNLLTKSKSIKSKSNFKKRFNEQPQNKNHPNTNHDLPSQPIFSLSQPFYYYLLQQALMVSLLRASFEEKEKVVPVKATIIEFF